MGFTLIKWGGSLITDKGTPRTPRPERLLELAKTLATSLPAGERVLLGHGSGSFGHSEAAAFGTAKGARTLEQVRGASRTWMRARELNQLVLAALEETGLSPIAFAPSSFLETASGVTSRVFASPLHRALVLGLLPVISGDVVMDSRQGVAICSTEQAIAALIPELGIGEGEARVLWLGTTDGILDEAGETIPLVDAEASAGLQGQELASEHTDVTGGMGLRFRTAWELAGQGIESWILNGTRSADFAAALRGDSEIPGATRVPRR